MKVTRRVFRGAVFILLVHEDQVLVLRRANTGYRDGQYTVPAGHLEGNETAIAAAIREAKEEVNVTIATEDAMVVGIMHRGPEADQDFEYVDFYVLARRWAGDPTNNEPEKCDDVRWAPMDRLPASTIPYIARAIRHGTHAMWFDTYDLPA